MGRGNACEGDGSCGVRMGVNARQTDGQEGGQMDGQ